MTKKFLSASIRVEKAPAQTQNDHEPTPLDCCYIWLISPAVHTPTSMLIIFSPSSPDTGVTLQQFLLGDCP